MQSQLQLQTYKSSNLEGNTAQKTGKTSKTSELPVYSKYFKIARDNTGK